MEQATKDTAAGFWLLLKIIGGLVLMWTVALIIGSAVASSSDNDGPYYDEGPGFRCGRVYCD